MSVFTKYEPEEIGNAVLESIKVFDEQIQSLKDVISFGLNDSSTSVLFEYASKISMAIGGISLAIAVILAYIAIVREGLSLKGDWKSIVTILLRLAIAKGLIDASTQFVAWIYSFPAKITSKVIEFTSGKDGSNGVLTEIFNPNDVAAGLGINKDSTGFELATAMMYARLLGFFFYIISLVILIIVLARILKIYTLLAFSSVVFAKIPLNGLDSCKDYIMEMCALGLQGGVISASVCMFEVANTSVAKICSTNSSWGSFGSIIVLAISLVLLILKSEEIARKVI